MIKLECVTVPDGVVSKRLQLPSGKKHEMNTEQLRRAIEEECQRRANDGWTLRAMGSRGRSMYLVFARKER